MALYLVLLLHVCWERFLVFLEGVFFYFIKADIVLFCFCLNLSAVSFVSQVWSFHCNRACPYLSVVAPSQENYPIVLCFLKLIRWLAFLFFSFFGLKRSQGAGFWDEACACLYVCDSPHGNAWLCLCSLALCPVGLCEWLRLMLSFNLCRCSLSSTVDAHMWFSRTFLYKDICSINIDLKFPIILFASTLGVNKWHWSICDIFSDSGLSVPLQTWH